MRMIPEIYPRRKPKAILFDWDNTLVDTWRVTYDSINYALEAVGEKPISLETFWTAPHRSVKDDAERLFGKNYEKAEKLFYEAIEKYHLKDLKVLEGAEPLLKHLDELGVYLGVVSNKSGQYLRKEVQHLKWDPYFQKVVGSRDHAEDKPSPLPVFAALEKSNVEPSHDVWFVGDSIVDVHCARAAGLVPIVVGKGEASQEADVVPVGDCLGLVNLIKTL